MGGADPSARVHGVHWTQLARAVFGDTVAGLPDFHGSARFLALFDALSGLGAVGLVDPPESAVSLTKITHAGRLHVRDPLPTWAAICRAPLDAEQERLLHAINRLTVRESEDHAALEWIDQSHLGQALDWPGGSRALEATAQEMELLGLLDHRGWANTTNGFELRATYRGLVWQTRRGYTVDAAEIDALVERWETTSVDFKRELRIKTKDEKAEFVKDVLGLATTQASPPHLMIIGYDDKTHTYWGPPDPAIKPEHLERVLAEYTEPMVLVEYRLVDLPEGRVGRLEVLREPTKLPYRVRKSVGHQKRIEEDQIFVRHGSHTEAPTPQELQRIEKEGDRARARAALN